MYCRTKKKRVRWILIFMLWMQKDWILLHFEATFDHWSVGRKEDIFFTQKQGIKQSATHIKSKKVEICKSAEKWHPWFLIKILIFSLVIDHDQFLSKISKSFFFFKKETFLENIFTWIYANLFKYYPVTFWVICYYKSTINYCDRLLTKQQAKEWPHSILNQPI